MKEVISFTLLVSGKCLNLVNYTYILFNPAYLLILA